MKMMTKLNTDLLSDRMTMRDSKKLKLSLNAAVEQFKELGSNIMGLDVFTGGSKGKAEWRWISHLGVLLLVVVDACNDQFKSQWTTMPG